MNKLSKIYLNLLNKLINITCHLLSIISLVFSFIRIHFLLIFFKIIALLAVDLCRNVEIMIFCHWLPHVSVWFNKRVCFWFSEFTNTFKYFLLFLIDHVHFLEILEFLDLCLINFFHIHHFFLRFFLFFLHHFEIISIMNALDSHSISINDILLPN